MDNKLTVWTTEENSIRRSLILDAKKILYKADFCDDDRGELVTVDGSGSVEIWDEHDIEESRATPPVGEVHSGQPASIRSSLTAPLANMNILGRMSSVFKGSGSSRSLEDNLGLSSVATSPGLNEEYARSATETGVDSVKGSYGYRSSPQDVMELEAAKNAAVFERSRSEKLSKQVDELNSQLRATALELKKKEDELQGSAAVMEQLAKQWQIYHETTLSNTANLWKSYFDAHAKDRQEALVSSASVEKQLEGLKDEHRISMREKAEALDARLGEVRRLKRRVRELEVDRDKRGFMDSNIFAILKGTKCMDVQHSLRQDEARISNLTSLIASAMNSDMYLPATTLMDSVRRHKAWETECRGKLCKNIRSLVLEAEIEFAYKRHDAIKDIESLRDKTLVQSKELASKLRSDVHNVEVAKKRCREVVEEMSLVDAELKKAEDKLSYEQDALTGLPETEQSPSVQRINAGIQECQLEVKKWIDVKKEILYAVKLNKGLYERAVEARDRSEAVYEGRKKIYDEGISQAFVCAIKIVSDAEEVAAAKEYKKKVRKEGEKQLEKKEKNELMEKKKSENEAESNERSPRANNQGISATKTKFFGSPASYTGTQATWHRIREKIQGKYDFDFSEFVSKDGKFNRGDVPFKRTKETELEGIHNSPINRALFVDSQRSRNDNSRRSILETCERLL